MMLGLFGFVFALMGFAISALCFLFWLWMLIDCIKSTGLGSNEKVVWVLVIIFLPFLGSLIYFFAGRKGGA